MVTILLFRRKLIDSTLWFITPFAFQRANRFQVSAWEVTLSASFSAAAYDSCWWKDGWCINLVGCSWKLVMNCWEVSVIIVEIVWFTFMASSFWSSHWFLKCYIDFTAFTVSWVTLSSHNAPVAGLSFDFCRLIKLWSAPHLTHWNGRVQCASECPYNWHRVHCMIYFLLCKGLSHRHILIMYCRFPLLFVVSSVGSRSTYIRIKGSIQILCIIIVIFPTVWSFTFKAAIQRVKQTNIRWN